ncbi:MAG: hypothetical protein A3I89_00930 [Candidatus Harrisonbacteria bacterium RIFCSPLOWO2_02_FULL_41_11]|uniref:Uncharacterized protein n=1 Tax=Candidatus Harrisonbacteria bacterium RIFCSPHIGHO2_02_FULL_42_16 TaxID=1798404 RepID=A0A1G1ZF76_9BACT|nr:MAG: hypothetical protein A3B92_03715 [Candidatus Harrisonbacteria bacterium RIFCSPHIGHO2_02_FULL_42_16]OGY66976.1 MAG: hypothetical protein A3I89_00930 [Candidatus Harrisonbacteria bacterium RIFCSPLOWO2_02_FULL_41_11]
MAKRELGDFKDWKRRQLLDKEFKKAMEDCDDDPFVEIAFNIAELFGLRELSCWFFSHRPFQI